MSSESTDFQPREFDLGDILSITTGKLVSPRHIEGVYDILNYMTGDSLFTHQLPRAMDECQEPLFVQHPELRTVNVPESFAAKESVEVWLILAKDLYGETLPVWPLGTAGVGTHVFRDPIAELVEMVGPERVIPVVI